MIIRKSLEELEKMKQAGRLVAATHQLLATKITPGLTTKQLDQIAEEFIVNQGAQSAFKGYQGFPATICASVNEAVVHGIPSSYQLQTGDIVSLDIGVIVDGYYGDAARTLIVGHSNQTAKQLLAVTKQALEVGISQAQVDNRLSDISHAIQEEVTSAGYSVVRRFFGHGIGQEMHEDPKIPNFGPAGKGPQLKPGMVFAIEPMVNLGGAEVEVLEDGWTVVTKDRKLSAHFEDTVAITEAGPQVLTRI